ncbi:hypothetical protein VO57_015100 [Citromicrobium bathyomarinum]|nr:hypothetical protein [Citromicrobium sp. JL2201]KPM21970.1 hypothetical protein VO57_14025 [Citromicrobium sp. JL2201]
MKGAAFDTVRRDLRERGLLGSDNRLTEAGHRRAVAMLGELRNAEAPSEPPASRVRWNHTFRQRRR